MNDERRRLLPPIGMLAGFIAAARQESFSRAGNDVGLTQSAISRQIATLENWLGLPLFRRNGRRVELTPEGRKYADAIGPALDRIRSATGSIIRIRDERELTIATLPSFGMRWLAPRLPRLSARHPDLHLNFVARSFPFDFSDEPFQAAIHFGLPDWPRAVHDYLFSEQTVIACSPARLRRSPIRSPADILAWPLLVQSNRRNAWAEWFKVAGLESQPATAAASFEHFAMLAQAAAAGAGLALLPRFLIEPEISDGSLVVPLDISVESKEAYYFVSPEDIIDSKTLNSVRSWILHESSEYRRDTSQ